MSTNYTFQKSLPIISKWVDRYGITTDYSHTLTLDLFNGKAGSSLPNWKRIILAGGDATTGLTGFREKVSCSPCSVEARWPYVGAVGSVWEMSYPIASQVLNGYPCPIDSTIPLDMADFQLSIDRAKESFVKEASKYTSPVKGLVVLGELTKALRMIKNPFRLLQRGFVTYEKKVRKSFRLMRYEPSHVKKRFIRDSYLEATYGWGPLIADIDNGLLALEELNTFRPFTIKKVKVKAVGTLATAERQVISPIGGIVFTATIFDSRLQSCSLHGGIKLQNDLLLSGRSVTDVLGFKPQEILPAGWELLPWSFLFDYVTNIGEIIEAAASVNGLLSYCSQTTRSTCVANLTNQRALVELGYVRIQPATLTLTKTYCSRTKISDVTPDFRFSLPGFGTRQTLNTAFLALSRAGK